MRAIGLAMLVGLSNIGSMAEPTSVSISVNALSSANAEANEIRFRDPNFARCGFSFSEATSEDTETFLNEAAGVWRDGLSSAVATNDGRAAALDGILIGSKSVVSARIRLEEQDFISAETRRQPISFSVGSISIDGFRMIRLNYETNDGAAACETYAIKLGLLADNRDGLFVRGPLSGTGINAQPETLFHQKTRQETRLFTR